MRSVVVVIALLVSLLTLDSAAGSATPADPADQGRRSFNGTIEGADYRVEVPEQWNGTLLLYSHGYYPPGFQTGPPAVTNNQEAEDWLVDHGFALAASNYRGVTGFQVAQAQRDQLALLDWFDANVGRPDRTIVIGQSMGAAIADLLAENHPERFDGVLTVCSAHDPQGTFNVALDMGFAVKTLLAPDADIDLVRARDPQASTQALQDAIDEALRSPRGRARLALVASLDNVTGWFSAHEPPPTTMEERIADQAAWIRNAYVGFTGSSSPLARVDLESKVGGNPSFNVGIDYRHQFARSSQGRLVREAYREAGLDVRDLRADLDELNDAPRIAPDPAALDFMYRTGVPRGTAPVPVVTLHSAGDGGAVPDQERSYAQLVRRNSRPNQMRQLYVERGMHCSFSAADEVVALQTLLERIETGRWPSTSSSRLNAAVSEFDPHFQQVLDLSSFPFQKAVMPPAFTRFTPPRFLRPSL